LYEGLTAGNMINVLLFLFIFGDDLSEMTVFIFEIVFNDMSLFTLDFFGHLKKDDDLSIEFL
jgi:hypothetical protein